MKILLIEDDSRMAQFLTRHFKREGISVCQKANGREALTAALSSLFDFVILDLILPGMRGEEVLKEIRGKNKNVPIIVLSAIEDCETRIRLLNSGADDYVTKPFYFAELMARVRCVLKRSGAPEERETIIIKDLRIIPKMRSVYYGKKSIRLRPREYDVLEYMARRPGQIVSRHTLIEQVWGYDARVSSNTVDAHISSLRKKMKTRPEQDPIETVQGLGYILSPD